MEADWHVLRATLHCQYKAWQLVKNVDRQSASPPLINNIDSLAQYRNSDTTIALPIRKLNLHDKFAVVALYIMNKETPEKVRVVYEKDPTDFSEKLSFQTTIIHTSRYAKQGQKLLSDFQNLINNDKAPTFYRNKHCRECQFWNLCHKKLIERDCISLLEGISPKALSKYHNKGIFSTTQLSHTFRPRRRSSKPTVAGNYLWELKALAIREKKTFILNKPDLIQSSKAIYLDFEGIPDEGWVYLLGVIITREGEPDQVFSFWAENKEEEKEIFYKLLSLIKEQPEIPIYHYGSYEIKALKRVAKKWPSIFKKELPALEKRMINVLGYLRTHVYPPTYSNGLKEVAGLLGFHWVDSEADGLHSILWRKNWEATGKIDWKKKLLLYNQDDCNALIKVTQWLMQLAVDTEQDGVQQVAQMKKVSPYKFHNNPEFGDDFKFINKSAYFDYQRTKIYWRNQKTKSPAVIHKKNILLKHPGRGVIAWKPKKVNEVVVAPNLKICPHCGNKKLYDLKASTWKTRQTDLKFTSSGIKQWVVEHQSHQVKCAKCGRKHNNSIVRMLQFGDNLFAWVINLYVRYYISHEMISFLLQEQFGIWTSPGYLVNTKFKWCIKWQPEVDYIRQIILNSPVIHIDETSVRLSENKGYVWAFATPHTVFYHFTLTREADFLHDWLKNYKGVIVTDFFPGYEGIKVKQQRCLVHLIRDLNDDLFKNPFDEEYKEIVMAFGQLLRKIVETIDRYGLRKFNLKKHQRDVKVFFHQFIEREHSSELSIKYAKRLRKHWEELWTFLYYDDLPWNNNNAEAAIKAFAQYRRGVNCKNRLN